MSELIKLLESLKSIDQSLITVLVVGLGFLVLLFTTIK
jgi:hypothetical protein